MLLTPDRRVDGELACMILITFLLYSIVLYVRADERIKLGRRHQHLRTSGRSDRLPIRTARSDWLRDRHLLSLIYIRLWWTAFSLLALHKFRVIARPHY